MENRKRTAAQSADRKKYAIKVYILYTEENDREKKKNTERKWQIKFSYYIQWNPVSNGKSN